MMTTLLHLLVSQNPTTEDAVPKNVFMLLVAVLFGVGGTMSWVIKRVGDHVITSLDAFKGAMLSLRDMLRDESEKTREAIREGEEKTRVRVEQAAKETRHDVANKLGAVSVTLQREIRFRRIGARTRSGDDISIIAVEEEDVDITGESEIKP